MIQTLIVLYFVGAMILFIRLNFTQHAKKAWGQSIKRYLVFLIPVAIFSVFWFISFPVAYIGEIKSKA